jgi:pimeloyl-ACP methyl ester carboxylesterase
MRALAEAAERIDPPEALGPLTAREVFDDFCVASSTLSLPVFQTGAPPYEEEGGEIRFDAAGAPILDHHEPSRVVITVPRGAGATLPVAVFIRTGGGGDRPLVDRGVRSGPGGPPPLPGTGPALQLARAGFAGVSIDGPHGGPRNVTGGDEQFLVINPINPVALRDNLRQSAFELILLVRWLEQLRFTSACTSGEHRFDLTRLTLIGHSMGATIAPLVLAHQPRYRAAVLSGAGGSWLLNMLHKKSPLDVRAYTELLLEYSGEGRAITAYDPVLSLVQWAGEAADPPVFADRVLSEARHVLMFQGVTDTYIPPPVANALSLSLGLDLAEPALEDSLAALLPLVDRKRVSLPASANLGGSTAVVSQHDDDGVEDGHEVMYQREETRHQYRCFLESFAREGVPRVPPPAPLEAPCL